MLKNVSPGQFLADYWQKRPLFLPSAVGIELPTLDADELAWLATQEDVESRLVFTERTNDKVSYRVEHGPFSDADLNALPAEDWTLLVQDVEKHLPDFREYFGLIPFVPSWRIDDLMVSFAAPGGSVGPHKDNYDVFLCQGEGSRNWRVSENREAPNDASSDSLSLLEPFKPTEERLCHSGDVLYIPPGVPHWGIAKNFCTTYSIGMRAPTKIELDAGYARIYLPDTETSSKDASDKPAVFYSDPDLQLLEANDGLIGPDAVRRIREQHLLDESLDDLRIVTVLGSVVTDPKAWLDPDAATEADVEDVLAGRRALQVHGMALVAWAEIGEQRIMFVNGHARKIPQSAAALIRTLCVERVLMPDAVHALAALPGGREFLTWVLEQGILDTS